MRAKFGRSLGLAAATLAVVMLSSSAATAAEGNPITTADPPINYKQWASAADFGAGTGEGTAPAGEGLAIGTPAGTEERPKPDGTPVTYDLARWTSPAYPQGFGADQLVASWSADTPAGTWIKVEMQGTMSGGATTPWFVMGEWAAGDGDIQRTSVDGQSDASGSINTDTFVAADGATLESYQLRATLYRATGTPATPTLRALGAMTSAIPDRFEVPTSPDSGAWGKELPVPRYSQNTHVGEYPEYGGGGEAWCSPTSVAMVTEFWKKGPTPEEMSWIDPNIADPVVPFTARATYDKAYDGTGNWSFNTAYAASRGLNGHVTRLPSLGAAEQYISAGVPVITSISFKDGDIPGSGYGTAGHLMVIVGFTETGDVIVNDPASDSNEAVRNVYPRGPFETAWQRTQRYDENGEVASGSGGVAYIIAPPGTGVG